MTIDCIAVRNLIYHLGKGAYTQKTLNKLTGMSPASSARWFKVLKGTEKDGVIKNRVIFIESWTKSGYQPTPVWAFGIDEPHVPRPKPLTSKQYSERARIKAKLKKEKAP